MLLINNPYFSIILSNNTNNFYAHYVLITLPSQPILYFLLKPQNFRWNMYLLVPFEFMHFFFLHSIILIFLFPSLHSLLKVFFFVLINTTESSFGCAKCTTKPWFHFLGFWLHNRITIPLCNTFVIQWNQDWMHN